MANDAPLVLVSNRGPVTFDDDGSFTRGGGGLVTALTGLASHRDAVWIASAMTDGDVAKAQENEGRPFRIEASGDSDYHVRLVRSDPEAYDRFYNVVSNPMLWFIQHYLWDLSNAPDITKHEVDAFEHGYKVVNEDLAAAVIEQIDGEDEPVVMVHDYHLYTLPAVVRAERPDVFLHHFIHIPWTQPDAWRVLPRAIREEIYEGVLANDIVGFHTRSYRWNFLQCCRDLMGLEVDFERGIVQHGDREVWVRAYPLPIDYEATRKVAASDRTREFEDELKRRRRDHVILRVDRADLSKNVLRGFAAFDQFLEQHPEFLERVTFIAQLMPSRMDVEQYRDYLRAHRAPRRARQPSPRHAGLDADPAEAARRPRGGRRGLQELRRDDRQRDVRRHEPRRQGGAVGERVQRRLDPVGEHRRARGARRVRAERQPVRHLRDGGVDPRGADDERR